MNQRVEYLWGVLRQHLSSSGFKLGGGGDNGVLQAIINMKTQESGGDGRRRRPSFTMARRRSSSNIFAVLKKNDEYVFDLTLPAFQERKDRASTSDSAADGKPSARVMYDWADQHTLSWDQPIKGPNGGELQPGKCNMYLFPTVFFAASAGGVTKAVGGVRLEILSMVIKKVAEASGFGSLDGVGAPPICALIIANNSASLELGMDLFEARPLLLTHQHGPGPFTGEHAMHILVVNRNEELLCRCLQLATRIPRDERIIMMGAQTTGGFFSGPPMLHYGSSVLGYAAAFGLRRAVWMMVTDPQLNLDLSLRPCGTSGFFPLHAAVVAGQTEMYDFLTDPNGSDGTSGDGDGDGLDEGDGGKSFHLPLKLLADPRQTTALATVTPLSLLTSLQLAALFGNQPMFTHIVRKQAQVRWMWGPLACFAIDAQEVDKAASVVARLDSTPATQSLLLDSCLEGLMHELLLKKWRTFAGRVYRAHQMLGGIYLLLMAGLGFALKEAPGQLGAGTRIGVPLAAILSVVLLAAFDGLSFRQWWRMKAAVGRVSTKMVRGYLSQIDFWPKLRSYACCCVGCTILISLSTDGAHDATGTLDEWVWMFLGLAIFAQMSQLTKGLFLANQRLGIQALVINKMLATDVLDYLLFLSLYLLKYYATLYIIYPRAGDGKLYQVAAFNDVAYAFKAMADFALTGAKFKIDFEPQGDELPDDAQLAELSTAQVSGIALFAWYYIWCAVMLAILLVRLLMAMMTNTYNSVRVLATRHWRLQFARCVLQMEMIAGSWRREEQEDNVFHEMVTNIKVVDGVFKFQLFDDSF